ncbi:ubiquinone/menaquinone biosynthesis methyltransferase [Novipirellula aureliae]|uniref:Ubiquinone/menaquinone biosynthesis methyltransferase n=1 Tax=Novipirellula aureliae TaxID=2527966 RepID=A0A5C6DP15_9BACT|nr:class I SAM-dependent methyltransferase [Novipirellula aureliae]TWU36716.1 ubiquinone/menaquinone biosynthesis methyltransferase [Novipirellula aureliae]
MSDKLRSGYDRLAPWYQMIERLRFGGTLDRARVSLLPTLLEQAKSKQHQERLEVLFLGDGDGRLLAAFLECCPDANVFSVDVSAKMLAIQQRRIKRLGMVKRVNWLAAPVDSVALPSSRYDIVFTAFFLDCFDEPVFSHVVSSIADWLRPEGIWYLVDFQEPGGGIRRIWAKFWLHVMHVFFRWQTGLASRRIIDPQPLLKSLGFRELAEHRLHFEMIRASLHRRV